VLRSGIGRARFGVEWALGAGGCGLCWLVALGVLGWRVCLVDEFLGASAAAFALFGWESVGLSLGVVGLAGGVGVVDA
jgi:hypothetical protein